MKTEETGKTILELCPCLDSLFPDTSDRVALHTLADLGVRQYEIWDWREHDVAALRYARAELGLQLAAFSGTTFAEPLLTPEAHASMLTHLRRSLDLAESLGTTMLVTHVGYAVPGRSHADQRQAAADGLRAAGSLAGSAGVTLLVEPLNSTIDHPGYFLDSLPAARTLIADVGQPSVRLLLDVYHMWLMHPDLVVQLPDIAVETGHLHVADAPGRHEPGTGAIPWPEVMAGMADGGYRGMIGLEYWPLSAPADALAQTRQLLRCENASSQSSRSTRSSPSLPESRPGSTGQTGQTGKTG
ncbi:MAG TPA: TIM barrel protein [bacterium]